MRHLNYPQDQREFKSEAEYQLNTTKSTKTKNEYLDPYHTHFILVDDAKHDFGGEVKFRADLEKALTKEEDSIPIVVLVIGGGPRTAESVYEAVKYNTPCVFLDVFLLIDFFFN